MSDKDDERGEERWRQALLWFRGWQTSVQNLMTAGWEFRVKRHFTARTLDSGRVSLRCDGHYIYLNHPDLALFGRFTMFKDVEQDVYMLDFMVTRKQLRRAALKTTITEIGAEDIGELLDLIKELQSDYPTPKPPPARVLTFKKAA
jgi:hypothetical protein